MKNVIKPLAKSVLISLGLTTAASAADAGIHKKILGSGTAKLIISSDEMEDIMKIVKYLEYFGLLLEGVSETIQNEAKEQKGGLLGMLLGTLGASLLGNILTGKGFTRAEYGSEGSSILDLQSKDLRFNKEKGIIRAGYGSKGSLIKNL